MTETKSDFLTGQLLQGLRVLYVEDDADTLQELSRYLKKRVGFLVSVKNGLEALEAVSKYPFDILITDLRMPGMDGLSLVRTLRENGSRFPVIITSAFSDSDSIIQAVDLGIVKYCIKPINTAELTLTLERLVSERHQAEGIHSLSSENPMDRQQKLEYEKIIRSEFAHMLKTMTGKGPKDIQVVFGEGTVTICITEACTLLEQTLMNNPANTGLIAYLRKTLYTEARTAIESILLQTLHFKVSLWDIEVDPARRMDRVTLRY